MTSNPPKMPRKNKSASLGKLKGEYRFSLRPLPKRRNPAARTQTKSKRTFQIGSNLTKPADISVTIKSEDFAKFNNDRKYFTQTFTNLNEKPISSFDSLRYHRKKVWLSTKVISASQIQVAFPPSERKVCNACRSYYDQTYPAHIESLRHKLAIRRNPFNNSILQLVSLIKRQKSVKIEQNDISLLPIKRSRKLMIESQDEEDSGPTKKNIVTISSISTFAESQTIKHKQQKKQHTINRKPIVQPKLNSERV